MIMLWVWHGQTDKKTDRQTDLFQVEMTAARTAGQQCSWFWFGTDRQKRDRQTGRQTGIQTDLSRVWERAAVHTAGQQE